MDPSWGLTLGKLIVVDRAFAMTVSFLPGLPESYLPSLSLTVDKFDMFDCGCMGAVSNYLFRTSFFG